MGLLPEAKRGDPQCRLWATQLRDALKKRGRITMSVKLEPWEKEFQKLRRDRGYKEIDRVLWWYIQHMTEDYIPQVHDALSFKEKFARIKEAMDRSEVPETETVSDQARRVSEKFLNDNRMPPEIAIQLTIITQRTMNAWDSFLDGMEPHSRREEKFCEHVTTNYGATFVVDWLNALSHRYGYMPNYAGSVLTLAFRPASHLFRDSFWRKWSLDWTGEAETFDALLLRLIAKGVSRCSQKSEMEQSSGV